MQELKYLYYYSIHNVINLLTSKPVPMERSAKIVLNPIPDFFMSHSLMHHNYRKTFFKPPGLDLYKILSCRQQSAGERLGVEPGHYEFVQNSGNESPPHII
jgi:hypothetical protein